MTAQQTLERLTEFYDCIDDARYMADKLHGIISQLGEDCQLFENMRYNLRATIEQARGKLREALGTVEVFTRELETILEDRKKWEESTNGTES